MALLPMERMIPINRSRFSLFDPKWEVGTWDDFGFRSESFEKHFRQMEKEMEQMFRPFPRLLPLDPVAKNWVLESPIIRDAGGEKELKMDFDVRQFKPEEITVKTMNNQLSVHAKHEEKTNNSQSSNEYYRMYSLPTGMDANNVKSTLSPEGILSIEAKVPTLQQPKEQVIPIQRLGPWQ